MAVCINTSLPEYRTLVEKSGISEEIVKAFSEHYMDKLGRFPHLDELPFSNSEQHLIDTFKIKDNYTKIDTLLQKTGTNSIEEAKISLNDFYEDLEIDILPLVKSAQIYITKRPSTTNYTYKDYSIDKNINIKVFLSQALNKLNTLFGVKIIPITSSELNTEEWKNKIPDSKTVEAFISEGNIYINTDIASADAPIHEIFHLFIGQIRFKNPELYQTLLNKVSNLSEFPILSQFYQGRTQNDILEEVLVDQLAKKLTGQQSYLDKLSDSQIYEIFYNIDRVLDSILKGNKSSKSIPNQNKLNLSLKSLGEMLESSTMQNSYDQFKTHRILQNTKADMLKNNELEQICQ